MIDERQEELASLHSFGLLEGRELEQFTAELGRNPELRRLVAEFRTAAAALAHTAPDAVPPEALKARVLASVDARLGAKPIAPGGAGQVVRLPSWIPWLAAACIGGRGGASTRSANGPGGARRERIARRGDLCRPGVPWTRSARSSRMPRGS